MASKVVAAGTLKKGSYVMIEDVPCRVADTSTSKPGKHGSAKIRIVAIGLLDDKKRDVVMPASDSIEVPIVEKKNAQVLFVEGNSANVMDQETFETFNIAIPEEFQGQVHEGSEVMYWDLMGEKVIKQVKAA